MPNPESTRIFDLRGQPLSASSMTELSSALGARKERRLMRNLIECLRALKLINERLGLIWQLTSFVRHDNPAHAEGRAVDFAARSGPLWDKRRRNVCPAYHIDNDMRRACANATNAIAVRCPRVHLILIEPDHLHIEISRFRLPSRLDIVPYAVRSNALCTVDSPIEQVIATTDPIGS